MAKLTREQLDGLPLYQGSIRYNPETGMTYQDDDGSETGYAFERATWTGPFSVQIPWPRLNPLSFATRETAVAVFQFVSAALRGIKRDNPSLTVELDETQRVTGPFTRTIERSLIVRNDGAEETFSAGQLAVSIIKNGEDSAGKSFLAELRVARLVV